MRFTGRVLDYKGSVASTTGRIQGAGLQGISTVKAKRFENQLYNWLESQSAVGTINSNTRLPTLTLLRHSLPIHLGISPGRLTLGICVEFYSFRRTEGSLNCKWLLEPLIYSPPLNEC